MRTFSNTVSSGKISVIWNVRAMPQSDALVGGEPVTSRPSNMIVPDGRRKEPADQVEEGGLAGAVRSDDRAQLAFGHLIDTSRTATRLPKRLVRFLTSSMLMLRSCRSDQPEQAAREEQHDQHEQQADERHPVDRDARNVILQHDEHDGAEQRAPERAHAAHHRHDDEIARLAVVQPARIGEIVDATRRARRQSP